MVVRVGFDVQQLLLLQTHHLNGDPARVMEGSPKLRSSEADGIRLEVFTKASNLLQFVRIFSEIFPFTSA